MQLFRGFEYIESLGPRALVKMSFLPSVLLPFLPFRSSVRPSFIASFLLPPPPSLPFLSSLPLRLFACFLPLRPEGKKKPPPQPHSLPKKHTKAEPDRHARTRCDCSSHSSPSHPSSRPAGHVFSLLLNFDNLYFRSKATEQSECFGFGHLTIFEMVF